jgi:hypothetical protein
MSGLQPARSARREEVRLSAKDNRVATESFCCGWRADLTFSQQGSLIATARLIVLSGSEHGLMLSGKARRRQGRRQ